MADAKVRSTATLDEATEAGFLGSHVDIVDPDAYTLQGAFNGLDITSDEYAQLRAAEAHPPDVSTLTADTGSSAASDTSKSSKATSSKS